MIETAIAWDIRSAVVIWDRGSVQWERKAVAREVLKYLYERIGSALPTTMTWAW